VDVLKEIWVLICVSGPRYALYRNVIKKLKNRTSEAGRKTFPGKLVLKSVSAISIAVRPQRPNAKIIVKIPVAMMVFF